jgi:hypothetical protein
MCYIVSVNGGNPHGHDSTTNHFDIQLSNRPGPCLLSHRKDLIFPARALRHRQPRELVSINPDLFGMSKSLVRPLLAKLILLIQQKV